MNISFSPISYYLGLHRYRCQTIFNPILVKEGNYFTVFFTDRVKALFFLLTDRVPVFLVIFLASIFVLAPVFLTLFFAWRAVASAVLLVLAAPFFTLLLTCRAAVVFTALLVLPAPFFTDLNVLDAALG